MSDKINRLIQQANIDKERADRLLEEIKVMDEQIAALTRELAEARDKALEEAAVLIEQRDGEIPDRQEIAAAIRALKEKP